MRTAIILFSISILFSCKNAPKTQTPEVTQTTENEPLPQDYLDFYKKFHTDSLYQMAHILFPLPGSKTTFGDSVIQKQPIVWQKEEWVMHRTPDLPEDEFEQKHRVMGGVMVIEYIKELQTGLIMERRFAKTAGTDWELIYYSDL